MNGSQPWQMTTDEIVQWLKKQTPFLAGYAVVFLTALQQGKTFAEALGILQLYLLNVTISFLMTISKDTRT